MIHFGTLLYPWWEEQQRESKGMLCEEKKQLDIMPDFPLPPCALAIKNSRTGNVVIPISKFFALPEETQDDLCKKYVTVFKGREVKSGGHLKHLINPFED